MNNTNDEVGFFDSKAGKVLGAIILIPVVLIGYVWSINSSMFEGKILGFIDFRMPLENAKHYCDRKNTFIIVKGSTSDYWQCIATEGDSAVEKIQGRIMSQSDNQLNEHQAECLAKQIEKNLTQSELKEVADGGQIDRLSALTSIMEDIKSQCIE